MITSSSESRLNFVWDANAAKLSDSFERCFQVASDYYYYFIYSHISIIIIIITIIIIIIVIILTLDIALSLQLPTNKIYDMKFGKY